MVPWAKLPSPNTRMGHNQNSTAHSNISLCLSAKYNQKRTNAPKMCSLKNKRTILLPKEQTQLKERCASSVINQICTHVKFSLKIPLGHFGTLRVLWSVESPYRYLRQGVTLDVLRGILWRKLRSTMGVLRNFFDKAWKISVGVPRSIWRYPDGHFEDTPGLDICNLL